MKMMKAPAKKSVTLTETLVGSVILALVFGGLMASFLAARKYVARANTRLVAANLGRSVLNELYSAVRADTWDDPSIANNPLSPQGAAASGNTNWRSHSVDDHTIDGVIYANNEYEVRRVTGQDYRQVRVSINYPID